MENFIKPEVVYGFIEMSPKSFVDRFFISECRLSIEKINGRRLINLWADSSHFEIYDDEKVRIGDIGLEILMPIGNNIDLEKKNNTLLFPVANSEMIDNWEIYYDSTIYDNEHLRIVNCSIDIIKTQNGFQVGMKGYISDDIETYSENHYFEAQFEVGLSEKIETKYNWNYSPNNENNYRQQTI